MPTRCHVVAIAAASAALVFLPSSAYGCTLGLPGTRDARLHPMIVRPTPTMLSAARGLPRDLAGVRPERDLLLRMYPPTSAEWWRARFHRWKASFGPPLPMGQVVRVARLGGASPAVRAALARHGGEAVLVQWALATNCRTALYSGREPRLSAGRPVFVAARLRARSGWVHGRLTFDVFPQQWPYAGWRAELDSPPGEPLTVEEYWTLRAALPTDDALLRDTATALAPLRAWVRSHPRLARRWPAPGVIASAERNAASSAYLARGRGDAKP